MTKRTADADIATVTVVKQQRVDSAVAEAIAMLVSIFSEHDQYYMTLIVTKTISSLEQNEGFNVDIGQLVLMTVADDAAKSLKPAELAIAHSPPQIRRPGTPAKISIVFTPGNQMPTLLHIEKVDLLNELRRDAIREFESSCPLPVVEKKWTSLPGLVLQRSDLVCAEPFLKGSTVVLPVTFYSDGRSQSANVHFNKRTLDASFGVAGKAWEDMAFVRTILKEADYFVQCTLSLTSAHKLNHDAKPAVIDLHVHAVIIDVYKMVRALGKQLKDSKLLAQAIQSANNNTYNGYNWYTLDYTSYDVCNIHDSSGYLQDMDLERNDYYVIEYGKISRLFLFHRYI